MRYVAFKHERFTDINKVTYVPLFDVELDRVEDACKLFWSHVQEPMMNAKFNMNQCVNNIRDKGFDDECAFSRIYEKYQIITYVIIEYDFEFRSKSSELFSGPHYQYWLRDADKMRRELKIKTILND